MEFVFSESLFEPALKVWTRFVEGELRITDKIQQQIMHVGSVCSEIKGSGFIYISLKDRSRYMTVPSQFKRTELVQPVQLAGTKLGRQVI